MKRLRRLLRFLSHPLGQLPPKPEFDAHTKATVE